MDILDIDAVSYAARVGHIAAAEIFNMLQPEGDLGELSAIPALYWYFGKRDEPPGDRDNGTLQDEILAMAGYVARRRCSGETLYHWNAGAGRVVALVEGGYADQPIHLRQAYEVFTSSVTVLAGTLIEEQLQAEKALDAATAPPAPAIAIEDTIFEPEEGLGKLRPEAIEAQKLTAAQDQAIEAKRLEAERAAKAEEKSRKKGAAAKEAVSPPAPLSVGEPPASKPINRGGRGKKKSAADRGAGKTG